MNKLQQRKCKFLHLTLTCAHTVSRPFPILPLLSSTLFSPSIIRVTVRVEAGWRAVSGAIMLGDQE